MTFEEKNRPGRILLAARYTKVTMLDTFLSFFVEISSKMADFERKKAKNGVKFSKKFAKKKCSYGFSGSIRTYFTLEKKSVFTHQ